MTYLRNIFLAGLGAILLSGTPYEESFKLVTNTPLPSVCSEQVSYADLWQFKRNQIKSEYGNPLYIHSREYALANSDNPILATSFVRTCINVVFYDLTKNIGLMTHMLEDESQNPEESLTITQEDYLRFFREEYFPADGLRIEVVFGKDTGKSRIKEMEGLLQKHFPDSTISNNQFPTTVCTAGTSLFDVRTGTFELGTQDLSGNYYNCESFKSKYQ